MHRRAYRITGRVQGVGFRWFTRHTATALGLSGVVRNAADGSVEVEAAGALDQLAALEDRLREGPPGARVEGFEILPPSEEELPETFMIAR